MCYELMTHPLFSINYLFFSGIPLLSVSLFVFVLQILLFRRILIFQIFFFRYLFFQYVLFIRHFFVQHFPFIFIFLLFFLFSEVTIYFDVDGNQKGDYAARHHDDVDMSVSQDVFQITRNHARKHQTEIGNTGTDGVVGGLELALTVEQHVERKHREA